MQHRIANVITWTSRGIVAAQDIELENGIITNIIPHEPGRLQQANCTDGGGLVLMPAGVDPQVHLRVPGQREKETAASGLHAALKGGFAAVLTMPNTKPVIDDAVSFRLAEEELAAASKETGVLVKVSAAITKGQKGREVVDFKALAACGAAAFTDDGVGVMDDDLMRAAFRASAETGLPLLQHAEVAGHGAVLAAGPMQNKLGLKPYPESAETDMVARDLKLLHEFPGARYHVLHISSAKTLELIAAAKSQGLAATCEVSPHHLYFCASDITDERTSFKMNPPLRSAADRQALRRALQDGLCDFVATDHAPHESAVKGNNFKTAAFGTTGLETSLRVLLTLHQAGELSASRLVAVFSQGPARFLGLPRDYGELTVGSPLRALLVDVKKGPTSISERDLASQSKNNCFLGTKLCGELKTIFLHTRMFPLNN